MIRDRNTTIALIIASAMIQLFIQTINGERFNVPGTLGGTLAFILIPYLLSLLIRFIIRVTTKKFSENSFFTTFMIAWVLVILSSIVTAKYESNLKKDDSSATSASDFKYSPRGCLFEITYKQKPSIKQLPIVNGKSILRGEEASVTLQGEYFKSELFVLSTDTIKSLEEDSQIYFLNQYAINNGFDHPEFKEIGRAHV